MSAPLFTEEGTHTQMARVNIEDSIFTDYRFMNLVLKLGNPDTALGALARAWRLAQDYYLREDTGRKIPLSDWKQQGMNDALIEVNLARVEDDHVYVSGSETQFAWLAQKSDAGKAVSDKKLKQLQVARQKRWGQNSEDSLNDLSSEDSETPSEVSDSETLNDLNGSEALTLSPSLSHSQKSNKTHTRVKVDQVIELFNQVLANKAGRIKFCHGLSGDQLREFVITTGFKEFATLEDWRKLFESVKNSPHLNGTRRGSTWVVDLSWLTKHGNALKVKNGVYPDECGETKKGLQI